MGFKADTSFLRFLTMGARGVHHTMAQLADAGFEPIELERYCGSNKIWATKVKRLRLADVLCVRTGLRVEVRAKSDLKIRMSDAPGNPDRAWDAGLRKEDLIAFVACRESDDGPVPFDRPVFFNVEELRKTAGSSKLGQPKSASEGAERDRTWPATIPSRSGKVTQVTSDRIVTHMFATDDQPARNQSFTLKGKTAYVKCGDTFTAGSCFLSGTPASTANLTPYLSQRYDPLAALEFPDAVDRYAGVKALRFREDEASGVRSAIESLIGREAEPRVKLEAAASATALGSSLGEETIAQFVWKEQPDKELAYLRMEAVLILAELKAEKFAAAMLKDIATHEAFVDDEIRQAAVWGLGKTGLKRYDELLPFIADSDQDVVLHAIAAFGPDTPLTVIERLVEKLALADNVVAPAASQALREIGTDAVLETLVSAYEQNPAARNWILATLGRMPPDRVRNKLQGLPLMDQLEPMLLFAPGANWLSSEDMNISLSFLLKQNI